MNDYTVECTGHQYITLEHDGRFVFCLDNGVLHAEDMILRIEARTGLKFKDIPVKGSKTAFEGLVFFHGGWHRRFWDDFPSDQELAEYRNLVEGKVAKA